MLTDGRIYLLPDGEETKAFDVRDGHGIVMAHRAGLRSAIISGRQSFAVRARVQELGIAHLYEQAWDKMQPYENILALENLSDSQVCYVGDDVVDIPLMRRAGLAVAVADAVEEVKSFAHLVTRNRGGHGAVREVVEYVLSAQDLWQAALNRYRQ